MSTTTHPGVVEVRGPMATRTSTTPGGAAVAAAAARIVVAGRPALLGALAEELRPLLGLPVDGVVAALTPHCPRSPVKVLGRLAASGAELARLAEAAGPEGVTRRTGRLAGAERDLLLVAVPSTYPGPVALGSLFAVELAGAAPAQETVDAASGLCAVVAAFYEGRAGDGEPQVLGESLIAETERARAIAELSEVHEVALTGILATLRSRALADGAARRVATDAASAALVELRAVGERDRAVSETAADAAFERLGAELDGLARTAGVALDLAGPGGQRLLPGQLAHVARGVTRGIVLVLLDAGPSRLRVAWAVSPDALTVTVRDDGDGAPDAAAFEAHRTAERLAVVGGELHVDAAVGWGTTVTATLPLAPLRAPDPSPLRVLNAREREVLDGLVAGRRNADIGAALSITPHTVKFHVANILRKLEVSNRGEAAALARTAAHR